MRCVLAGVLLALGAAPVAYAEPDVPSGAYRIQYADGEVGTWVFTPCGPDCTSASAPDRPFVTNWQFRLTEGQWAFSGPNELACPTGGTAPVAVVYGFDPVTLAGYGQATLAVDTCGAALGKTMVRTFQLTRT